MTATEFAKNCSNCDYCKGCVDFRFDRKFTVVETDTDNLLKCPTCSGNVKRSRRVEDICLSVGDKIQFSGSTWTIAKIEDGKVYGIGGMTFIGYTAVNPVHLFSIHPGYVLTLTQIL